jgi:uncharacterized membrane protein
MVHDREPQGLHAAAVVLPIGLLAASVMFDLIGVVAGAALWSRIARMNLALGVIGGLVAAAIGVRSFRAIPIGTRSSRAALAHGLMNATALALFATSFALRLRNASEILAHAAVAVSTVGLTILLVASWIGGELHGVARVLRR